MANKFTNNEWSKDCVENEYVLLILNSVQLGSDALFVLWYLLSDMPVIL